MGVNLDSFSIQNVDIDDCDMEESKTRFQVLSYKCLMMEETEERESSGRAIVCGTCLHQYKVNYIYTEILKSLETQPKHQNWTVTRGTGNGGVFTKTSLSFSLQKIALRLQ